MGEAHSSYDDGNIICKNRGLAVLALDRQGGRTTSKELLGGNRFRWHNIVVIGDHIRTPMFSTVINILTMLFLFFYNRYKIQSQ